MLDSRHIMVKYFEEEIDIHKENHKVSTNNQIQLEYLPSKDLNISVYLNNKEIDSSKYTIDYENGVILFTDTFINQIVLVDYSAIGEICISASKVYTNYDNKENILETLESLIDEQREIINQINVVGDVRTIILQMEQNINNLVALYDDVINNEEILNNINQRIQECINKKDELVLAINNAIEQANTAKNQLITATTTANNVKDELISTKNSCKTEINTLVSNSKSEMNSFTSEKKNELTQTANTCVNNVNNATITANNKMSELNQWLLDNGDIVDLNNKVDNFKNHLFYNNAVKMIAHRGFSGYSPENTITAFRLAGVNKYWGCEVDVNETSDGQFVIMHDTTVDRTTNGTGEIATKTLAQIKELNIDAGTFVTYNPTLKVPTLEEFLQVCKEYGMIPIIEIKNIKTSSVNNFLDILNKYQVLDSCMLISFDKTTLEAIRTINKKIEMAYLTSTLTADIITYCVNNRFHVNSSYNVITKDLIQEIHSKGILIGAWTVDEKTTIKTLIDNGIDFVTTNGYLRGKEEELHKPYVETGGFHYGRHTYTTGVPYEFCHTSNLDDVSRIYTDKLNRLEGWETKVGVPISAGYKVAVLFYDKNKLGIGDLGWITNGTTIDIPSNALYYEIYIGKDSDIELTEFATLRTIRAVIF